MRFSVCVLCVFTLAYTVMGSGEVEIGGLVGDYHVVWWSRGKVINCDEETYMKPLLEHFATTFENYKSCNEETQTYILSVSGYDTELQAGKNGNYNQIGNGFGCFGGDIYYVMTKDTEQATWDALKASPPDEAGVVVKCLIKEGSSGGGGGGGGAPAPATSDAMIPKIASAVLGLFLKALF
jgi:hypothetical protein